MNESMTEKSKRSAKTKPLKKPELEKITIEKQVVTDLASCVLWALKFLKVPSGAGMSYNFETGVSTPWQEKFMLALDGVGYSIDRKDFWKKQGEKKKTKKRGVKCLEPRKGVRNVRR